jgi:hypothetical protein
MATRPPQGIDRESPSPNPLLDLTVLLTEYYVNIYYTILSMCILSTDSWIKTVCRKTARR